MFAMNACSNNIGTFVKMGDNIKTIQTIKTVFNKSEQLYCVECNKKTQKNSEQRKSCAAKTTVFYSVLFIIMKQ